MLLENLDVIKIYLCGNLYKVRGCKGFDGVLEVW